MSGRFWVLLISLYGFILLGLAFLNGGMLALALPLLVYMATAIQFAPAKASLQAARELSAQVVDQDTPVKVKVVLTNEGSAIDELILKDLLPSELHLVEGETHKMGSLPAGAKMRYEFSLHCTRGRHSLRGIATIAREHFGLFEQALFITAPGEFQSFPEIPILKRLEIRPRQTRGFSGPIPTRQGGSGMSFLGVREYQIGDALHRLNWKVSARNDLLLFTNQFEQERIADVGLILDARKQTNLSVGDTSLFEYSVLATAALAEAFLKDGHRVSLLIYGFGMERVFPGYGKVQRQLILRALSKAEVGSNFALESLNYLPTRLFPARSQLVMISPLGARDFPAFARLRKDGYEVMLISPDPVSFEMRSLGDLQAARQAFRLAYLERGLLLRKLTHLGVQVVDWPVEKPFDQTIRATLGRRSLFRRNLRSVAS